MKHIGILVLLSLNTFLAKAREFNKNLNLDSLFHVFIKGVPVNLREDITASYNGSSSKEKEFMLIMLLMPGSSKKQLVQNIDTWINYDLAMSGDTRQERGKVNQVRFAAYRHIGAHCNTCNCL